MKRTLFILLLIGVLMGIFSCSLNSGEKPVVKYDIELTQVRKASDITQRYHAPIADTEEPGRYAYEDDLFRSIWSASEAGWELSLNNKSEKPMVIDWDEVVYMDVDKMAHSVMSKDTKYAERENPQNPSAIVRRGNLNEKLFPKDYIYQSPTGGLAKRPMFPIDYSEAQRYKGKTFSLIIPFTVDGLTAQYEFVFKIKDVRQELSANNPWTMYILDRTLGAIF